MDSIKFKSDNSLTFYNNPLLFADIFLASSRIESVMLFIDESNKIKYSYNIVLQKNSRSIFAFCLLLIVLF